MRILASNPDSIGDVVLRQPLYAALREAGHQLTLIVRPMLVPLMPIIAPGAQVLVMPVDPYAGVFDIKGCRRIFEAASAAHAEMLLVAPYQWTMFEEMLALAVMPETPRVGMTGRLFPGDPRTGLPANESRMTFSQSAEVSQQTPELRKNELLCSMVLGRDMQLPRPKLSATPSQIASARSVLTSLGIKDGTYEVACVGHYGDTAVRNWDVEKWANVLSYWGKQYGRKFVLVGSESEQAISEKILNAMGPAARETAFPASQARDLETLLGLLELSRGYVGKDTGPMHIAAALGKPVLAIFGGGTWPRFLPAVEPSISLTTAVPCTGCDWVCHLPESYCVKSVREEDVIRALDDLEAGRATTAEVRTAEASPALVARIVQESAAAVRDMTRQAASGRRLSTVDGELRAMTSAADAARSRAFSEEARAQELAMKLARVEEARSALEARVKELEDACESEKLQKKNAEGQAWRWLKRVERMSSSRWHRIGKAMGLRLESVDTNLPAIKPDVRKS